MFSCLSLFLLSLTGCAQQIIYATATAEISEPSVYAQLNFTTFTQPAASGGSGDSNLRMRFGNDGGDQLDLVLEPVNGGFPTTTYYITSSGPSLSFTAYSNGQPVPLNLTIDEGFINLNVISIVEGIVTRAEGEFHLNFADPNNGSIVGTFVYATPAA